MFGFIVVLPDLRCCFLYLVLYAKHLQSEACVGGNGQKRMAAVHMLLCFARFVFLAAVTLPGFVMEQQPNWGRCLAHTLYSFHSCAVIAI